MDRSTLEKANKAANEIRELETAIKDWGEFKYLGRADGYSYGGGSLAYRKFMGAVADSELVKAFQKSVIADLKVRLEEKKKEFASI